MNPAALLHAFGNALRRATPSPRMPSVNDMCRILCIDDNPEFLRALHRQLAKLHHVVLACGVDEGLEAIATKGPFDIIICDLRMPGVEGVSFLDHLWEVAPDTERLILTGWADPVTLAVAPANGRAMRLLLKPCPPPVLREAIADALLRLRARRLRSEHLSA